MDGFTYWQDNDKKKQNGTNMNLQYLADNVELKETRQVVM
jgi:hypothetical protein